MLYFYILFFFCIPIYCLYSFAAAVTLKIFTLRDEQSFILSYLILFNFISFFALFCSVKILHGLNHKPTKSECLT